MALVISFSSSREKECVTQSQRGKPLSSSSLPLVPFLSSSSLPLLVFFLSSFFCLQSGGRKRSWGGAGVFFLPLISGTSSSQLGDLAKK